MRGDNPQLACLNFVRATSANAQKCVSTWASLELWKASFRNLFHLRRRRLQSCNVWSKIKADSGAAHNPHRRCQVGEEERKGERLKRSIPAKGRAEGALSAMRLGWWVTRRAKSISLYKKWAAETSFCLKWIATGPIHGLLRRLSLLSLR